MSEAFSQFQQAIESYRARQREVQGELETNRARKVELLAEFDRAVIEGTALAPIQARIAQLENEYELLNRKAAALANADKSETLRSLVEGVVTKNSAHLQGLRTEFHAILKEVEPAAGNICASSLSPATSTVRARHCPMRLTSSSNRSVTEGR